MSDDIVTQSGKVVGQWSGRNAQDLIKELSRIMKELRSEGSKDKVTPEGIPHRAQLPDDLHTFKAYKIWGCDIEENCVCGANGNRIVTVDDVRRYSLIDYHDH